MYLVVGKRIICTFNIKEIPEAIMAYLTSYYALNFDYPQSRKLELSILQFFSFEDQATPINMAKLFNNVLAEFNKYVEAW
jgi:preprotein translocase subunit SecB